MGDQCAGGAANSLAVPRPTGHSTGVASNTHAGPGAWLAFQAPPGCGHTRTCSVPAAAASPALDLALAPPAGGLTMALSLGALGRQRRRRPWWPPGPCPEGRGPPRKPPPGPRRRCRPRPAAPRPRRRRRPLRPQAQGLPALRPRRARGRPRRRAWPATGWTWPRCRRQHPRRRHTRPPCGCTAPAWGQRRGSSNQQQRRVP